MADRQQEGLQEMQHAGNELKPESQLLYAGFRLRTLAGGVDFVITAVGVVAIDSVVLWLLRILGAYGPLEDLETFSNFTWAIVWWLYFCLLESSTWQATLGKRMLRLKVTDERGQRIGFGRANARYWSKVISGVMLIGFIMIGLTKKSQGLHDKFADTLVLTRESRSKASIFAMLWR